MRGFDVSYQRDKGYSLIIWTGFPKWRKVVESVWEGLCWATRGVIAGHGCPQLMWKVPVWRPKRDEDGWLINSVAGKLNDLEGCVLGVLADYRPYEVAEVPISVEVARRLAPEMVEILEEDNDE